MCLTNYVPCASNSLLYGSDHLEHTQESQLTADESKHHGNKEGSCKWE